jgi:hypothetical protein
MRLRPKRRWSPSSLRPQERSRGVAGRRGGGLVGALDPADQQRILAEVEDRADVETLLRYDPETAGGIMTAQVVSVREDSTAAEAIDACEQAEEVEDFPTSSWWTRIASWSGYCRSRGWS